MEDDSADVAAEDEWAGGSGKISISGRGPSWEHGPRAEGSGGSSMSR
jgi:hypothetical protein